MVKMERLYQGCLQLEALCMYVAMVVAPKQMCLSPQGVLPNMMKLAPAAGISWFMFEEVKRRLGVDIRS